MTAFEDRLLDTPPTLRLDGKVTWVTGASRGLGRALAYALAGAGCSVLLTARSADGLDEVAERIRAHGGEAATVAGSITDQEVIGAAVDAARERWGRLDVLVNNAGISPSFARAERVDMHDWRRVLDVNLTAPLACCRAALPLLEAASTASVVNVSSVHAVRAHERLIAYSASKGGLDLVTRTLALEWAGRGIRVNSVAPGYLETEMTEGLRANERLSGELLGHIPMRRFGSTADVAGAVLFLAGDAASYVTGTTLFIDGGWTAA